LLPNIWSVVFPFRTPGLSGFPAVVKDFSPLPLVAPWGFPKFSFEWLLLFFFFSLHRSPSPPNYRIRNVVGKLIGAAPFASSSLPPSFYFGPRWVLPYNQPGLFSPVRVPPYPFFPPSLIRTYFPPLSQRRIFPPVAGPFINWNFCPLFSAFPPPLTFCCVKLPPFFCSNFRGTVYCQFSRPYHTDFGRSSSTHHLLPPQNISFPLFATISLSSGCSTVRAHFSPRSH